MAPADFSRFCCQNPGCPDQGRRDAGGLTVCARDGRRQRRLLYRKTCKARFSEGCGVRQTSQLAGVSKDTVQRLGLRARQHARRPQDELVGFSPRTTRVEPGEKWSFVAEKGKDTEADWLTGDQGDHVAPELDSRLVLEAAAGPRTRDVAVLPLGGVRHRLGGRVPELVCSDEHAAYPGALPEVFEGERVPPRRAGPVGLLVRGGCRRRGCATRRLTRRGGVVG